MKKIALATVAAAALAASGGAYAYTSGTFSNGFVVPNVIHNGSTQTTAVGIINRSGGDRGIYWTFFDENSNHVTDGCFPMTEKEYTSFNWMNHSGQLMEDQRGYLVFAVAQPEFTGGEGSPRIPACSEANPTLEEEGGEISANAFFVDTATDDVAFTPVIDGDLTIAAGTDLTKMNADSLTRVAGAAQINNNPTNDFSDAELHMRYTIGGGDTTRILVWSTGDQSGSHSVDIYNDQQQRKSVNFDLDNTEQDWFNPATIAGIPAGFTDGYILWDASKAPGFEDFDADGNSLGFFGSIYAVSYVGLANFGALQTLLGSHR